MNIKNKPQYCWPPDVFDKITKSEWATLAWHLANAASDHLDCPGASERRLVFELNVLADQERIQRPLTSIVQSLLQAAKEAEVKP